MLRNCLLSFLAGILFCWFIIQPLIYKITHPEAPVSYKEVVVTNVVVKKDTIFIPKYVKKTLTLSIPVARVIDSTIVDTVRIDAYAKKRYAANFTRKIYEDTVHVDTHVQVGYQADVTGILNGMTLSYKDTRPQMVIYDSIIVEKTKTIDKSRGLYIGVSATTALNYMGPHLMYLDNKGNAFRVGVNALSLGDKQTPQVSIGFSKKLW